MPEPWGVPDGCGGAGLGNRDDQITFGGMLAGEQTADLDAGRVDRTATDDAVGTREVDVLENTALGSRIRETRGADAVGVDRK